MENVAPVSLPVILTTPNTNILKNGVNFNVMLPVDNKSSTSTSSSSLIASYSMLMCLLSKMVSTRFLCSCLPTCAAVVFVTIALMTGKNYVKHCLLWLDTQEEWIVCTVFLILYTAVSFPLTWGYILLNLACGYHFGLLAGTVVTAIEASIGIVLAHILMKHYFVGIITARILNLNSVRSTLAMLESTNAFKLIAISRLTPIPFGLQNALFAISPICTWRYVWASAVGLLPTQVINVYLGTTVRSMEDVLVNESAAAISYSVLIIQVLLGIVLFVFILQRARHELNKAMNGDLKEILVMNGRSDSRCKLNLSYLSKQLPYTWSSSSSSRCTLQRI